MMCPLCLCPNISFYIEHLKRVYHHCPQCDLVFMDRQNHMSLSEERAFYQKHNNSINNLGYVSFLNQLMQPLLSFLEPSWQGLDYGSGPGPTLSLMLQQKNYSMKIYDPAFAANTEVLDTQYDFITCSEVVEHFHQPKKDFEKILKSLKAGGILGVMTLMRPSKENFKSWHYIRDPSHVSLYSAKVMKYLESYFNLQILHHNRQVTIYRYLDT